MDNPIYDNGNLLEATNAKLVVIFSVNFNKSPWTTIDNDVCLLSGLS